MEPPQEIAEYILQYREEDLYKFRPNGTFKFDMREHDLFKHLLVETRENFRNTVKNGVILAVSYYWINSKRFDLRRKIMDIFRKSNALISIPQTIRMDGINSMDHENKIITFECEVLSVPNKPKSVTIRMNYRCNHCSEEFEEEEGFEGRCASCHSASLEATHVARSEMVQNIILREPMGQNKNSLQRNLDAKIHGEYVGVVSMGDRVHITGIFKSIPNRRTRENDIIIDVINIEKSDIGKDTMPTAEELAMFKDCQEKGTLIEKLTRSIAYHIEGHYVEKLSVLLSLIEGNREQDEERDKRGSIHVLFVGDPSTAKSEIMKSALRIADKIMFAIGNGATGVGLGMGSVKTSDGTSVLMPGPIVQCNHGHVYLDEFDKMDSGHRNMLLEVMQNQTCTRNIAGQSVTVEAETSILACANPIGSSWDEEVDIMQNLDVPSALLSRFILVFRFLDIKEKEAVRKTVSHIKYVHDKKPDGLFSYKELTVFINYVKKLRPKMSEDAWDRINNFFVMIKTADQKKGSIPIMIRNHESLTILATAFAKLQFKDVIDADCAERAIKIYTQSLESFGMNVGQGLNESTLHEHYLSKEQKLKKVFNMAGDKKGYAFPDDLIKTLLDRKIVKDEDHAKNLIEKLRMEKKVIEKSNGSLKLVDD